MKRLRLLALVLLSLTPLLLAQPGQEISRSSLDNSATAIQAELESHGDRVLGKGLYGWSTRLNKIEECRAEFSVRVTSNTGEATVRTETVNLSLGAMEPYNIDLQKNWLVLSCVGREKCIFSTSTCSSKTKDGIVINCATPSQKRVESINLEFDGDLAAGSRLEKAFRRAIDFCRAPKPVSF